MRWKNARRIIGVGFLAWVILSGTAFYGLHFRVHSTHGASSSIDASQLPVKGDALKYYTGEHEDSLLTTNTPVTTAITPLGSRELDFAHTSRTTVSRGSGSETYARSAVNSVANLDQTQVSGMGHHRPPATLPSPDSLLYNRNSNKASTASYPGLSRWRVRKRHNLTFLAMGRAGNLMNRSSYKNRIEDAMRTRKVYMYRNWFHDDLQVARKWCTSNTCLLQSDVSPDGSVDIDYYDQIRCFRSAIDILQKSRSLGSDPKNCTCVLRPAGWRNEMVGLVSLPGSGNTWIRGLLEQVTSICTGSMWCDANLRTTQFCAEGMRGTKILAVKNHDPVVRWRGQQLPNDTDNIAKPQFDRVVFIHRNPYKAIVAEHNRATARFLWEKQFNSENYTTISSNDHVLYFGEDYFGNNSVWNETVYRLADCWKKMVHHLLVNSTGRPVLLVHYEDLQQDLFREMNRILTFLEFKMEEEVLRQHLKQSFTVFYRNHSYHFEHFTAEQRQYMNHIISSADSHVATKLPLRTFIHV